MRSEREAFEEWYKNTNPEYLHKYLKSYDFELDLYSNGYVQVRYYSWQASANREGYKLVPVEATDYMMLSARDTKPDINDYENMDKLQWEDHCGYIYKTMINSLD